jgi:hypothetical protein
MTGAVKRSLEMEDKPKVAVYVLLALALVGAVLFLYRIAATLP